MLRWYSEQKIGATFCRLSQEGQEATFHIDHVVPRAVGGMTTSDNLALACVSCSLRKWAKQTAVDPETGQSEQLYNPRMQVWAEHFEWVSALVLPLTPSGRATVAALAMNRSQIVAIRMEESVRGRHPPHTSPALETSNFGGEFIELADDLFQKLDADEPEN